MRVYPVFKCHLSVFEAYVRRREGWRIQSLDKPMILLTRKADFSAAHFYYNPAWSEAENERVFGKCANRQGHGHNYTLEVSVAGEIDPVSGFVVDLKQLKRHHGARGGGRI